jgi:cobyrinic acid a,c-diamide synthase
MGVHHSAQGETMPSQSVPRLILAAPMSGSGKTTVTAGLIAAFAARGMRVAPFKVGPDYIDPGYHALAAGRPCHNLDAWMLEPERLRASFMHRTLDADLALVEGVMGMFDGYSGKDDTGSSAHVARILDAPVLLVLDASAMARTAAAIVKGMRDFDPRVRLAGVILNRVGGAGHARMIQDAVEAEVGVPIVGYLKREDTLNLPERHLGLIPTLEPGRWRAWLDAACESITATVDLEKVLELARTAALLPEVDENLFAPIHPGDHSGHATIAVARDEAFNFTYEDNLDLLRAAGAEIVFFSPVHDHQLPRGAQALYLSGGFPEVYAARLAANEAMLDDVRAAFRAGLPIYAECGGLMYLTEEIVDTEGIHHQMAGVLPGRSVMSGQLTLGYRVARAPTNNWLWRAGETVRGHEFHYSVWEDRPADMAPAYELLPGEFQNQVRVDGACVGGVIASYVHIHFLAQPEVAERFVRAAASFSKEFI